MGADQLSAAAGTSVQVRVASQKLIPAGIDFRKNKTTPQFQLARLLFRNVTQPTLTFSRG